MASKRDIEGRLNDLEPNESTEGLPTVSVEEAVSADTVRVKESLEDAVVLVVDGEEKAMSEEQFGEFWVEGLKQGDDREE